MITKMIEVLNETLYGKERLRMEVLGLKTDLDSYKAIAASANLRAMYQKTESAKFKADADDWRDVAETTQEEADTVLADLREQQSYTMELVKKLNTVRKFSSSIHSLAQLPTASEDDQ